MDSLKLINFMENLRYDRKISQENYLDGIISQRQYYRYRSGESEIPFEVITRFAEKLNISIISLLDQFDDEFANEIESTLSFFNLVASNQGIQAYENYQKMKSHVFISTVNENLFRSSKLILDLQSGRIRKEDLINEIYKMLDYPRVMKKSAFPDDEIYMLGILMEYSDKDRKSILKKLYDILRDKGHSLGGNVTAEYRVYFWMIKNFGRNEQYEEVVEMCNIAIEKCEAYYMHYLLDYFHYYKALAHQRLGDQEQFEHHLVQSILNLEHRTAEQKQMFYERIVKDTGLDPVDFALKRFVKNKKYVKINDEE